MNLTNPMLRGRLIGLLLLVSVLSSGCIFSFGGDSEPLDPQRKDVALVFGYIDMDEAPGDLDWVSLKHYTRKPTWYYAKTEEGLFFHVGVDLGSYQVEQFGSNASFFSRTNYTYNFGTEGKNQTARRIKKPGVYYLGSYKYVHQDSGSWFKADKFSLEQVKKPSEKELLIKVLKEIEDDSDLNIYKHQIGWIKQRIAQL